MVIRDDGVYMLINQHDSDILSLLGEIGKGGFDGGIFCFGVDDEEVFLGFGRVGYVLEGDRCDRLLDCLFKHC